MARSSSDSPPQKPYSRFSRAQVWHGSRTGQPMQSWRALASRRARASGRSPGAAKNRSVCPLQDAIDCQAAPEVGSSRTSMTISKASDADTENLSERMRIPDIVKFLTTSEINAMRQPDRSDRHRRYLAGILARSSQALASRAVRPGGHRLALAAGVPGDAADRHFHAEPGGGALLLGLPAPEAVLPAVAGPAAARPHGGAGVTDGTRPGLANLAGLGAFARRREENGCVPVADRVRHPGRTARHRCGRQHGHDQLLRSRPGISKGKGRSGGLVGGSGP